MQTVAIVAVAIVCVAMVALAAVEGLADVTGYALLGLVLASGALVVAALRRTRHHNVAPLPCGSCGGLNSAQAPYCKHCGVPLDHSIEA
jgi:uncharacterized membrane protein YgdD (TMEM256/DUF423 family)